MMSFNLCRMRLFFAAMLVMTIEVGCKPRQSESFRLASSAGEDCSRILTEEHEIKLVNAVGKIAAQTLSGKIDASERNRQVESLLGETSVDAVGAAKLVVARTSDLLSSSFLLGLALNWTADRKLSQSELAALESLGVARTLADAYVADVASWFKPSTRAMQEYGFFWSNGWKFSGESIDVKAFKSPEFTSAMLSFFGSGVAIELMNVSREEAVVVDGLVFLPPEKSGKITVWEKTHWDSVVQRKLKLVASDTERFIKATKEASSYSNLMRGRIIEWFGGERGHQGKTASEIDAESAYKSLLSATSDLTGYLGTGPQMRTQMAQLKQQLLAIESANLQEGLRKLDAAQRAAIAAPFVPVLIWAAPYAGTLMAPSWGAVIGNASATLALMPMAFAAGSSAISATVRTATLGGDFLCNLHREFVDKGSNALFTAPFMAALPSVGALGAATVATASGGAICAGTVYGTLNLSLSVYTIKSLATNGIKGLGDCYNELQMAEQAGREGDGQRVDLHGSKAIIECVDAGIDLSFAMIQTGRLTSKAVEAVRTQNLKPLLGANCLRLSGGDCAQQSKEERKQPAGVDELSNVTVRSERLHQNISVQERADVIRNVALEQTASSPGHDYLRRPEAVVEMGKQIAASSDRGLAMFQGKDKMVLNIYTDSNAKVTGVEVTDGNHRFAAGIYAEKLAPGRGWRTIGDIPQEFLDIRVNGYNTMGQQNPRWVPLHTVQQGSFPEGSWREIPPEWGAKGPTAEIKGDVSSTSSMFRPEHRGVSLLHVLTTSLNRIGMPMPTGQ
jgi:hypothetical protein